MIIQFNGKDIETTGMRLTIGENTAKASVRCCHCGDYATDEQTPHPATAPRPQLYLRTALDTRMVCDSCAGYLVGPLAQEGLKEAYEVQLRAVQGQRVAIWQRDSQRGVTYPRVPPPPQPKPTAAELEAIRQRDEAQDREKAAREQAMRDLRAKVREEILDRLVDEELKRRGPGNLLH